MSKMRMLAGIYGLFAGISMMAGASAQNNVRRSDPSQDDIRRSLENAKRKNLERLQELGVKEYHYEGGIVIRARNQANADRKYTNLVWERTGV